MAEMSGLRRRLRSERGAELIETALTLPLILLVVVGIIEFGFVFQKLEIVTNAAREEHGCSCCLTSVRPTRSRGSTVSGRGGFEPASATLPTWGSGAVEEDLDGTNCISVVNVWVTYPHQALFWPGSAATSIRLSARSLSGQIDNADRGCGRGGTP